MISMHIPFGKKPMDLTKELTSAANIKDQANRKATVAGLHKIRSCI